VIMKRTMFLWIIVALLLIAAIPFFIVNRKIHAAKQFAGVLERLHVGNENVGMISNLLTICRSNCSVTQSSCHESSCDLLFSFDNRALSRLRIVPFGRFSGAVTVRQGRLVSVSFDYSVNCRGLQFSGVSVREVPDTDQQSPLQVSTGPVGKPSALSFRITPRASPDEKANLYMLNFACLSRRCSKLSELAPGLEKANLLGARMTSKMGCQALQ